MYDCSIYSLTNHSLEWSEESLVVVVAFRKAGWFD